MTLGKNCIEKRMRKRYVGFAVWERKHWNISIRELYKMKSQCWRMLERDVGEESEK